MVGRHDARAAPVVVAGRAVRAVRARHERRRAHRAGGGARLLALRQGLRGAPQGRHLHRESPLLLTG